MLKPLYLWVVSGMIIILIIVTVGSDKDSFLKKVRANDHLTCNVDDDCTTTHYPLHNCCQKCDVFPINKDTFETDKALRAESCKEVTCSEFRCLWPVKEVRCVDKKCVLVE